MTTEIKVGERKFKLEDVRPYWLYDTILAANGDVEHILFRTPDRPLVTDTNLKQFSQIQMGWTFDVVKMMVQPAIDISIADAEILFANCVVSYMKEGDIEIFSIPILMLNAGCGLAGAVSTTATATTLDMVSLGTPSRPSALKLPFPLTIAGGATFQFRIRWATALSGLSASRRIRLVLEGILRRGVVGA